jgi:cytochrome oxidase assembly protein ShyY1
MPRPYSATKPFGHPGDRAGARRGYRRRVSRLTPYRFLITPRWVATHLLVWAIVLPAFIWLAGWQERGYYAHLANNERLTAALTAGPTSIGSLDAVGGQVGSDVQYRQVRLVGVYDTAHQFLARQREDDSGDPGYDVVTPLVLANGGAVLVNRGWIAMGTSDTASPPIPAPPSGTVTVIGRLHQAETHASTGIRDETGLPAGQIMLIDPATLAPRVGKALYGGYAALVSESPEVAAAPVKLDAPSTSDTPYMYLVYWIQWWLFSLIVVGAWIAIIRQTARLARERAAQGPDIPAEVDAEPAPSEPAVPSPARPAAAGVKVITIDRG